MVELESKFLIWWGDMRASATEATIVMLCRAAFHAGYHAAQQPLAPDACPVCRGKKGYRDAFDEWYPCRACDRTGSAGKA